MFKEKKEQLEKEAVDLLLKNADEEEEEGEEKDS